MRLLVDDISEDFENELKEKVEHNIFHAEIREATDEDVDTIIELHEKAWHSTPMPYKRLSRKNIIDLIADQEIIFLIARVNNKDSGFALIYFTGEKNKVGVIAGLGVIPEFQGKGLGTVLAMACWKYFKERGVEELRCKVYKDNFSSLRFIKSLGFKEYDEDLVIWKIS